MRVLFVFTVIFLLGVTAFSYAHDAELTWQDASVSGKWKGYICRCTKCAWDRNWGSAATKVGLSNGKGDYFTITYSWPDQIKGDYYKVKEISAYAKEWSICSSSAGLLSIYNLKSSKWDRIGGANCGTNTFGKTLNGDDWFNYSSNSVKIHLSSTRGTDNKLYEVWVSKVKYWYNYFPKVEFLLPNEVYVNQSKINTNFSVYDPDGDPVNYTYHWMYNNASLNTNSTELDLNLSIGDKIVLAVNACDQYNCTEINHTMSVINFKPRMDMNAPLKVKGDQTFDITINVTDLLEENQSHNLTCSLENLSIAKNVSIGTAKINLTSPSDEGKYTIICKACDDLECTTEKKEIEVDNTPPKLLSIEIPDCTNLKNINWTINEDGYLEFSSGLNFVSDQNITEGNMYLCVRPIDIAGNIGDVVCKNVTVDLTPPKLVFNESEIFLPNATIAMQAEDICGISKLSISNPLNQSLLCSTKNETIICNSSLPRGDNFVEFHLEDNAGNEVTRVIKIRVNMLPSAIAMIPETFADSNLTCSPINISNEPDQDISYTTSWIKNGQLVNISNYSLAKRDNLTCILNLSDGLEWTLANASTTVKNSPPTIKATWDPEYPAVNEQISLLVVTEDVDGDNVTLITRVENETLNDSKATLSFDKSGNKTISVSAWDGENQTNTSLIIYVHECGNGILEPGEECDGTAKQGYICQSCRLKKIKSKSSGSSGGTGSGGSYSSSGPSGPVSNGDTKIEPKIFKHPTDWIDLLVKEAGYAYNSNANAYRTEFRIRFNITQDLANASLIDNVPKLFTDVECNIGSCWLVNNQNNSDLNAIKWRAKNINNGTTIEIKILGKEVLRSTLAKIVKESSLPELKAFKLVTENKGSKADVKASSSEKESKEPKVKNISEYVIEKAEITGMITKKEDYSFLLPIIASIAILVIGFKQRSNLRRLGIRLKAMATKMSSRNRNAIGS